MIARLPLRRCGGCLPSGGPPLLFFNTGKPLMPRRHPADWGAVPWSAGVGRRLLLMLVLMSLLTAELRRISRDQPIGGGSSKQSGPLAEGLLNVRSCRLFVTPL